MHAKQWHERGDGRPKPDLLRRQHATTATFAKYRRKAFSWERAITCAHLTRFHMKKMGHKVPSMPAFRSALGAKRALEAMGFAAMGDFLASRFESISPAEMLLGDLAVLPGRNGFDAVFVSSGNKLFGWMEDADGMALLDLVDAWASPIPDGFDAPPEMVGKLLSEVVRAFRL